MMTLLVIIAVSSPLWFYPLVILLSDRGGWTILWWFVGMIVLFGGLGVAIATHKQYDDTAAVPPLAVCWDGTKYRGTWHQGACSHHGGVKRWLDR